MTAANMHYRQLAFLLVILTGAFALRLWGVGHGMPYSYHNDEYHEVMRAFELGAGSFNFGRIGKGGLYLLLFVEYGFYFIVLKLLGVVNSATDFAAEFVRDPSPFYYMGRVTVVLMGTLTVFVAFLIARRAYATGAGLLAAIFLSVDVMHADMSQKVLVDVPMVFLAGTALYFAVRLAEEGSARGYIWAAVFASLATTTKIPAIVLVVPLLVAHTYQVRQGGGGVVQGLLDRRLWLAAALFAAILIATNPGIVFVYKYVGLFSGGGAQGIETLLNDGESVLPANGRPNLFVYYLSAMQSSMGWPLFLLGLLGAAYAAWRRTAADVVLLSFALVFYLAISSTTSDMYFSRYVLPVTFVVLVLAGRVAHELWRMSRSASLVVAAVVTAVLVAMPAYESMLNSYRYSQTDTRTLAKEWLEANIPEGAKVLIEGAKIAPTRHTVQLQDTAENLRRRISRWSAIEPRQAEFLRFKLKVLQGKTYDLVLVPLAEVDDLDAYREMGVEYFVITPRFGEVGFSKHTNQRSAQLAQDLRTAPDVTLIKRIEADPDVRHGPTVEIYCLAESG